MSNDLEENTKKYVNWIQDLEKEAGIIEEEVSRMAEKSAQGWSHMEVRFIKAIET